MLAAYLFLILIVLKVETSLSNLEEEYSSLHQLYDKVVFCHSLFVNEQHPSMFIGCGREQAFVRKDDWVGRRGS